MADTTVIEEHLDDGQIRRKIIRKSVQIDEVKLIFRLFCFFFISSINYFFKKQLHAYMFVSTIFFSFFKLALI